MSQVLLDPAAKGLAKVVMDNDDVYKFQRFKRPSHPDAGRTLTSMVKELAPERKKMK